MGGMLFLRLITAASPHEEAMIIESPILPQAEQTSTSAPAEPQAHAPAPSQADLERDPAETIVDTARSLIDHGIVKV